MRGCGWRIVSRLSSSCLANDLLNAPVLMAVRKPRMLEYDRLFELVCLDGLVVVRPAARAGVMGQGDNVNQRRVDGSRPAFGARRGPVEEFGMVWGLEDADRVHGRYFARGTGGSPRKKIASMFSWTRSLADGLTT